ncbi:MAG: amidohydrolase family protein [Acidimicrobiales bacterium]|nr:amidohydrolase family protein [Acidimicrobiales bacterium]
MIDLVIRNGLVADGTGQRAEVRDVAISDGRIAGLGRVDATAAREVDAQGKVVCPGFVDIHTHYDAQVFWDPHLTPSSLYGITTVIGGNCGFTIAPLPEAASERDYLMKMLARVEAMPIESLRTGVPWDWTTFDGYLSRLDGHVGVNVGFMVGHSTLRRIAMGPDAVRRECTAAELSAMDRLLRESLDAGALGFSSSGTRAHNDADGVPVPSRHAAREEILALAATVGRTEGTVIQWNPTVAHAFTDDDVELMVDMTAIAGRSLNWNVLSVSSASLASAGDLLRAADAAKEKGGRIVAVAGASSNGSRLSLGSGFVFDVFPGWEPVMSLTLPEKIEALRDPALRAELRKNAAREDNQLRAFADWPALRVYEVISPENEQYQGRTFGEIGEEQGRDPWDVMWEIAFADGLMTRFGTDAPVLTDDDWKARAEIWPASRVVVGASDAGAHVDMIASFDYPARVLAEMVRRRALLPLEEAVRMLADAPARLYGLRGRGQLREGWAADVVVFDPRTIDVSPPAIRTDLPGGAGRLYSTPTGVEHVFVNGVETVRNGELVGGAAGQVLRSGRDTESVPTV